MLPDGYFTGALVPSETSCTFASFAGTLVPGAFQPTLTALQRTDSGDTVLHLFGLESSSLAGGSLP